MRKCLILSQAIWILMGVLPIRQKFALVLSGSFLAHLLVIISDQRSLQNLMPLQVSCSTMDNIICYVDEQCFICNIKCSFWLWLGKLAKVWDVVCVFYLQLQRRHFRLLLQTICSLEANLKNQETWSSPKNDDWLVWIWSGYVCDTGHLHDDTSGVLSVHADTGLCVEREWERLSWHWHYVAGLL